MVALIVRDVHLRGELKHVAVRDATDVIQRDRDFGRAAQCRGRSLRPVSVWLRSGSAFGSRIRFQPISDWGFAFREDKIVAELRALARCH